MDKDTLKKNPFFVYGRVHPSEYDWKKQMEAIAKRVRKTGELYIDLDVGKILGLCAYIVDLEQQLARLREERDGYKNNLIDILRLIRPIRRAMTEKMQQEAIEKLCIKVDEVFDFIDKQQALVDEGE